MTEYDSPWKEAIDILFEDFMLLCFPLIHQEIDWADPTKMLDKELQQIALESEAGLRVVDKLVEVKLRDGIRAHQSLPSPLFIGERGWGVRGFAMCF